METYLPCTRSLGWRVWEWGWESSLPKYPSQIFIHHTWMWYYPIPCSAPPTSLDGCGFLKSMVVRLPFNSISASCKWWLFYILAVIFMWLFEEVNHVCLCCHLDWKSQACLLTSNGTSDLLVPRIMPKQVSHNSQDSTLLYFWKGFYFSFKILFLYF